MQSIFTTKIQVFLTLFESVFAEAGAGEAEVGEESGDGTPEEGVHVQLGDILRQHEAVAAHPDEEARGRVHDVARLRVVAAPGGLEAHALQLWNPLGEDLGGDLQESLRIDLQVLAGLGGVGGGGGAADDLARGRELLAIDGGEALVVAAVDEHVQRVALLADER